jgi:hypothetical protein
MVDCSRWQRRRCSGFYWNYLQFGVRSAEWGVESVIKPAKQRADGTRSGFWRGRMSADYLERRNYGSRWAVESFFSGLKRTMGLTLTSRKPGQLLAEAAFKVLAYTLRR